MSINPLNNNTAISPKDESPPPSRPNSTTTKVDDKSREILAEIPEIPPLSLPENIGQLQVSEDSSQNTNNSAKPKRAAEKTNKIFDRMVKNSTSQKFSVQKAREIFNREQANKMPQLETVRVVTEQELELDLWKH